MLAAQELTLFRSPESRWSFVIWKLPFEVRGLGELGRLTVSTQDSYGRLTSLYSLHLLLLAEGDSILTPPDTPNERCILETPAARQSVSGGSVPVSGRMRPFNDQPVVVELIAQDQTLLGSQEINVPIAPDGGYVPFHVDVPYTINRGMWALLVLRQADHRIPGLMYLYSQEIFLSASP
ncbi:MAG: hypothetical protein ABIN58_03920 [candidate division WOR-3 bacterium]